MIYSNDLPKITKTHYCIGRVLFYANSQTVLISYKSELAFNGKFKITEATLCYPERKKVKDKMVVNGYLVVVKDVEKLSLTKY